MKGCSDIDDSGRVRVPTVRSVGNSTMPIWYDGRRLFQIIAPLDEYLNTSNPYYKWIGTLKNPQERITKWDNMLELAKALQL